MSELSNPQGVRQPTLVRPSPEPEWLTYAQAGAMAALSRGTLWKLVSAGEVEAARVGRCSLLAHRYACLGYSYVGHKPLFVRSVGTRATPTSPCDQEPSSR
jgi:hypothetical protein